MSTLKLVAAAGLVSALSAMPAAAQDLQAENNPGSQPLKWFRAIGERNPFAPDHRTPVARMTFKLADERAVSQSQSYRKRHPVKFGAGLGAAIGGAVAVTTVVTMDCPPNRSCSTAAVALFAYPLWGAGLGALVGWMFGSK